MGKASQNRVKLATSVEDKGEKKDEEDDKEKEEEKEEEILILLGVVG